MESWRMGGCDVPISRQILWSRGGAPSRPLDFSSTLLSDLQWKKGKRGEKLGLEEMGGKEVSLTKFETEVAFEKV